MTNGPVSHDRPKRFYRDVTAEPAEGGGWQILLDGRSVKTPGRQLLRFPTEALALEVAEEWADQKTHIDLLGMHLTRLSNVALDRTAELREEMAEEVARYCETDLLCHIAEEPFELAALEEARWGPVRDWAAENFGVILVTTEGIIASPQPDASLQAARDYALGLDDFRLTALVYGCGLFGSALLSMAVVEGALTAESAFHLSRIDEDWQAQQWGVDEEAKAAADAKQVEADALGRLIEALQD
ncbi:ATPase [Hyphomonas sp. WL0036]|uniref:ATP12 family chaperone protein n=1 Tax=Hyphomonas sediminis TaxID=2866160 RepID=UPI001C7F7BFE|nr:ATP12 family protein [Hyphomonas sediminis]MBY9068275.1 ATPase [Hyphomonas sediminis]